MAHVSSKNDLEILKTSIYNIPEPVARPVLIAMIGLPGTGKSYLARQLCQHAPVLVLQTDAMRKLLFHPPLYTASESTRLFKACHQLIEELLNRGISILLDATNLVETHRERLYNIAEQTGAKLLLIKVEAPDEVVRKRLASRELGRSDPQDLSDAGISIYQKMRTSMEPIRRNHFTVDTSRELPSAIDKIVREIDRWTRS